jgi:hypothetical protein
MTPNHKGRGHPFLLAAGGSLLCLLLLVILLDPLPLLSDIVNVARIRSELPRARDRWQAQKLQAYRVEVKGAIPLACLVDGELTVHEGNLAEVRMRQNPLIPESPLQTVDPSHWTRAACTYEELTVEAMFDRLERDLDKTKFFGAPLSVEFDEQLGYLTEYRFGRSSQGGIFGSRISECCTWFEFSNLTDSLK